MILVTLQIKDFLFLMTSKSIPHRYLQQLQLSDQVTLFYPPEAIWIQLL